MSDGLSGVRADQRHSYSSLEKIAMRIRKNLNYPTGNAIKALDLFENLHKVAIKMRDGRLIRLEGGVVSLEDSEGQTRYSRRKNVMEILASEQTYGWLEIGHPRAGYFVAHELGHCILHTDQLVRYAWRSCRRNSRRHFTEGAQITGPTKTPSGKPMRSRVPCSCPPQGCNPLKRSTTNSTPLSLRTSLAFLMRRRDIGWSYTESR